MPDMPASDRTERPVKRRRVPAIYLCDLSYTPGVTALVKQHRECPSWEQHEPEPTGYVAWHEWAGKMMRTHRQTRCTGCDLLVIWTPRHA